MGRGGGSPLPSPPLPHLPPLPPPLPPLPSLPSLPPLLPWRRREEGRGGELEERREGGVMESINETFFSTIPIAVCEGE